MNWEGKKYNGRLLVGVCRQWKESQSILSRVGPLTSRQETDSSAHLDKLSEQHHVSPNSRFDLHSPTTLYPCLRKQHGYVLCLHFAIV